MRPVDLKCEHFNRPLGIDANHPRLSWKLEAKTDVRDLRQKSFRILVSSSRDRLAQDEGDLWDTGYVSSGNSIGIEYRGKSLRSRQTCFWKVRIKDEQDRESSWSEMARWSMGLLDPSDWRAEWISAPEFDPVAVPEWGKHQPSPLFRKSFTLTNKIVAATATICGLGYYELRLNGQKVGNHELDPVFTDYNKRCLYATYDVTRQVRRQENVIGVMLGNGWFNQWAKEEWNVHQAPWRAKPRFILNLHLVYENGTTEDVVSDSSWQVSPGPILIDGIRNGEVYDARCEQEGWDKIDFKGKDWKTPVVVEAPKGKLVAQSMPPTISLRQIKAKRVTLVKPGVYVFDFGQNMAGRAQILLKGEPGQTIHLRYGERLGEDRCVDQGKIKVFVYEGPFQTESYTFKDDKPVTWESRFTYHGFRYVQVEGLKQDPKLSAVVAHPLHTAFGHRGDFISSNAVFNEIYRITQWAYMSNYLGYPTDCPHREKNGWTGDAHLAAEMGLLTYDNAASYEKWLNDFDDAQAEDGNLPGIVPTAGWGYGIGPSWDVAYFLIPWYLWVYEGESKPLIDHLPGYKKYLDFLATKTEDGIVKYGLGDWVPADTSTPAEVTSMAYYAVMARIAAIASDLAGKAEDARTYHELEAKVRKKFRETYMKTPGSVANDSQCALSCAIYQGMADENEIPGLMAKLVEHVHGRKDHLDVGFLGAKYLFRTLSDHGYHDLAYTVANQTGFPSYRDWIHNGATTLFEDWKGAESLNHVAFGDIAGWFVSYLGGIQPSDKGPGYERFIVKPQPVEGMRWVFARVDTVRGIVASSWRIARGQFVLRVTVPPNTQATVWVPTSGDGEVTEKKGLRPTAQEKGWTIYEIGSGEYEFAAKCGKSQ
jgi:alpha-L-rhamnosidase